MIRPGVTSRRSASWSRASHSARTAPRPRRPRIRCIPDVRRHASTRATASKESRRLELLPRPLVLAGLDQLCGQRLPELHEHLDVERGVLQPRLRQRPPRPVDGRVLLLHPAAEHRLDQGGQADAWVAEQPPGQLGVEERARPEPDVGEAGQVLGGGVQDPLGALERRGQRRQRLEGDRVDQPGAGVLAAELDEVGATGVAVAGGPLGVDRDRSGAGRDRGARLGQPGLGVGDRRQPLAQQEQRSLGRLRARLLEVVRFVAVRHQVPEPRCPRRLGMTATPSGTGGSPTAVQSSSPQASTCGPTSSCSSVWAPSAAPGRDARRPRGADLQLCGGAVLGHPPEALRRHARHRARRHVVGRAVRVERVGEPASSRPRPASGR